LTNANSGLRGDGFVRSINYLKVRLLSDEVSEFREAVELGTEGRIVPGELVA